MKYPLTFYIDKGVGEVEHPAIEAVDAWTEQTGWAGSRYGFRPDQLNSFIAAGFNARLEALEAPETPTS